MPNFVKENVQQDKNFHKFYDFYSLVKVQKDAKRYKHNNIRQEGKKCKNLREPLFAGKKVFVLVERLKKKESLGVFYKSTTENKPFFNENVIFFIRRIALLDNSCNYWISKTVNGEIINETFLRQELFALKEEFI